MADNDNEIKPVSGELLPATSKLSEITKDLMIANSSFERSVTRIEKSAATDLSVELSDPFETIFRSMESSLKEISKNIKVLAASIAGTFFEINQNHLQSITVQKEVVAVADEQLGLDEEKFEYQKNQDKITVQQGKKTGLESKETKRESAGTKKGFGATFAKDLEDAEKEFQEKGFTKYIADLMGFGGTIQSVLKTISTIAPIFTVLGKSLLGFVIKIPGVMTAINFVKTAYLALQARIITGLTNIGTSLMSFGTKTLLPAMQNIGKKLLRVFGRVLLPLYAFYNAVVGFVEGFTANKDDSLVEKIFRGISRGIEEVINAIVMWPADLIKDVVSWIAGALGFTEIESFLDSFSFQEGFSELMNTFETWFTGIPDRISEWFSGIIGDLSTWFDETLANIGDFFSPLTEAWNQISEKISGIGDKISSFFSDLFDFSKIQDMLTNLFAEIGIPRIEFDLPVVGKVGFGPFYPFMPDANTMNISAGESVDTVSTTSSDGSVDTRKRTSESMITAIEGEQTEGRYARGARSTFLAEESIDASSGEEITTNKNKDVIGEFNTETGEGTIKYQARDANNELNNIMQEFNVSGITFGQVRRLIADGASPDEVRMFLENKNKSIFDKIGDFFSSPAETAPIDVAPADAKRTNIAQELGTQTAAREEARADQQSQQSVNVVNAPTSNVSNISQSAAYFDTPSAVDGLSLSY